MVNLQQIRASKALSILLKAKEEKRVNISKSEVSKLPAMIIANGLLPAIAFANENGKGGKKRKGMAAVMDGVAQHLGDPLLGMNGLQHCMDAGQLLKCLCDQTTPTDIPRASSEALELIGFIKRFARDEDPGSLRS
jgi:CRISPR/Cas system CMR-associated protein Cmr5 small subunit